MSDKTTPEMLREMGKAYISDSGSDRAKKNKGIRMLIDAMLAKDPEATYIIAKMILEGLMKAPKGCTNDNALALMCRAANDGCIQARVYLDEYCENRYLKDFPDIETVISRSEELVDFDGEPVKINRKGVFTPVDALLTREGDENVLTLSVNLDFLYFNELENAKEFEEAVMKGVLAWQGDYKVFGGQRLKVVVNATRENRLFDNMLIVPVTGGFEDLVETMGNIVGTDEQQQKMKKTLTDKRSFEVNGKKWTVNSRKTIYIQSPDGKFTDYDEIMHTAKHEFGHALGLGDLYFERAKSLKGVEKGTYIELDSYYISDRFYNLVMCDHHGPISNNDIEMVILAFRENKMQLYQPSEIKGKISDALGKGN